MDNRAFPAERSKFANRIEDHPIVLTSTTPIRTHTPIVLKHGRQDIRPADAHPCSRQSVNHRDKLHREAVARRVGKACDLSANKRCDWHRKLGSKGAESTPPGHGPEIPPRNFLYGGCLAKKIPFEDPTRHPARIDCQGDLSQCQSIKSGSGK